MADFTVTTPTAVVKRTGATVVSGIAGASLAGGKSVYFDSNDSKWKLAQADGSTAEAGLNGIGVALHASADGQPIQVITAGDFYCGAAAVQGEDYYITDTPGGLAGRTDTTANTGGYRTLVATGLASGDMRMVPSYTAGVIQ